jgi:ceramide glucosyltransferase
VTFVVAAAVLAFVSLGLNLWQWAAGRRFPLHGSGVKADATVGVTVLKPLKGRDDHTEDCLRSWMTQQYGGPVQILFGVASSNDPVCNPVRTLIAQYPSCDAKLVICSKPLGPNAKVSTLVQLEAVAAYEVLVVSDADVRAPAELLGSLVRPLGDPEIGLTNCLYRLANPANRPMEWEAVAINADFWTQVLQAQSLKPLDFALGAAMATTRAYLSKIGGFRGLLEYLADDFQLGARIAACGGRIELCPLVVECWSEPMGWRAVWRHQLRWARTIRACRPGPFFLSILSNGTFWPLLWLVLDPGVAAGLGALACWSLRVLTAWDNQRRISRRRPGLGLLWLVPLKDLAGAAIWLLAFAGNTIEWRGHRYRLLRDGRLVPA